MKKFLIFSFVFLISMQISFAKRLPSDISKTISISGVNKSGIAVSIKNVSNKKNTYGLNEEKPMPPASTLKVITFFSALDTLGEDYQFKTKLYKLADKEYQLELGGDPYLTSSDLNGLVKNISMPEDVAIKSFYIDDTLLDREEWGEGWQWDDDLNVLMPKFSVYNIDKNLLELYISSTKLGLPANIVPIKFYPITFMNAVISGNVDDVKLTRRNYISPDLIIAEGMVKDNCSKFIPINNMGRYFVLRLEDALKSNKVSYYGEFKKKRFEGKGTLIGQITHSMKEAQVDILKNSNNMIAETIFKIAGAKYSNKTGTATEALQMFYDYCAKNNLNAESIKIADASGVSKNNLMTADFMTDFLVNLASKEEGNDFKKMLPTAGEGTLTNRMLYFKDKLYAKTGTLTNVSALTGYIETKKGNVYAFCIMANDAKTKPYEKKMFEEQLLRAIYKEL